MQGAAYSEGRSPSSHHGRPCGSREKASAAWHTVCAQISSALRWPATAEARSRVGVKHVTYRMSSLHSEDCLGKTLTSCWLNLQVLQASRFQKDSTMAKPMLWLRPGFQHFYMIPGSNPQTQVKLLLEFLRLEVGVVRSSFSSAGLRRYFAWKRVSTELVL